MRLELSPDSRARIDLRAAGLLRAVGHDPTLSAALPALALDVPNTTDGAFDLTIEARVPVDAIEPPEDLPASDRAKMRENLRGPEVLDGVHWPTLDFRGRFAGTLAGGALSGSLVVRGSPHPLVMDVSVSRREKDFVVDGAWTGTLTELGIRPFKALLGALKLRDWIRLRLELHWVER